MIDIVLAFLGGCAVVYGWKLFLDKRRRVIIAPRDPVPGGILMPQMLVAATELANIMREIKAAALPGIDTVALDNLVSNRLIEYNGLVGYFRDFLSFPHLITASANAEVINTLPCQRKLVTGDLLKVQFGVNYDRAFAYQAWTFEVGSSTFRLTIDSLEEVLNRAISAAKPGVLVRSVTEQIESGIKSMGWYPSTHYCGHQIGSVPRMAPSIECVASNNPNQLTHLYPDMLLSVFLLAHRKPPKLRVLADGWNVVDLNGEPSIMLSHVIRVTEEGGKILTAPMYGLFEDEMRAKGSARNMSEE